MQKERPAAHTRAQAAGRRPAAEAKITLAGGRDLADEIFDAHVSIQGLGEEGSHCVREKQPLLSH